MSWHTKNLEINHQTQSNRSCDSDEEEMSKIPILAENNGEGIEFELDSYTPKICFAVAASMGGEQFVMVQYSTAVVVAQLGRSSSPVMCFDDSDIEEVEMA